MYVFQCEILHTLANKPIIQIFRFRYRKVSLLKYFYLQYVYVHHNY